MWHSHQALFGGSDEASLSPLWLSLVVSALAVPQGTHYVLDAVLWRRKDTGGAQARALGFPHCSKGVGLDHTMIQIARFAGIALLVVGAACSGSNDLTMAPTHPRGPELGADAPQPLESGRLPALAKPKHYQLALTIDPKATTFSGHAVIAADLPAPTRFIVMHGRELTLGEAKVVSHGESIVAEVSSRLSAHGMGTPDELVLTLPRQVEGAIDIDLSYTAPFSDQLVGVYKVESGGDDYAFTQFEPMDARRAFPCFDEPGSKVPFSISITAPEGNLAVANSLEVARKPSADAKSVTFEFAETKPLPTYLVAFAVGPLETREAKGTKVPLRVITVKGKGALADAALEAGRAHLDILEKYFDFPYPYDKLDLVAVPDFAAGAMENAGFITFREELILLDPKLASTSAQRNLATTVAHELSHHWFGDLVTMAWWDDLWLNEGFATWMETKVVDQWKPQLQAGPSALAWRAEAMDLDARSSSRPVRRPVASASDAEEAFDTIVYDKGAAVLGMLESWLGPEKFQAGVRQYLKNHAYGNATATDLFKALSDASGKDVVSVATTFLDQSGVPLVSAKIDCPKDAAPAIVLGQKRFQIGPAQDDAGKTRWKIPVCVGFDGDNGNAVCDLLADETGRIALPKQQKCPKWVIPNAGQRGYYRYLLAPEEFAALGKNARNLDAVTRFALLDDAHALVENGALGIDTLLDLVAAEKPGGSQKLAAGERLVIDELVTIVTALGATVIDDDARPAYASFVRELLLPLAKDLGFDPKKGESDERRLLRRTLLDGLAVLVDDPWIEKEAEKHALGFIADPESVDVDTATISLRASSRHAKADRLDALIGIASKSKNPQVRIAALTGLGSFEDPVLLRRSLDLMFGNEVKKQDGRYLVRAAAAVPAARPTLLAWMAAHTADMKDKLPSFERVSFLDLADTCDKGSVELAHKAFDGKFSDAEGGERALGQFFERAGLCIDLRAREAGHVRARFGAKPRKTAPR